MSGVTVALNLMTVLYVLVLTLFINVPILNLVIYEHPFSE